jgi:hypothetical protein
MQSGKTTPCTEHCGAGEATDDSKSSCKSCPIGKYQDKETSVTWGCIDCTPGYYAQKPIHKCGPCQAGQYQPLSHLQIEGSESCIDCPIGFFGADESAALCNSLPPG